MSSKSGMECPINKAVELFNKKWTIQLIRDMFFGKKQFKDFPEDKPNLSNKVLSQRLKEMEEKGLIEKRIINTSPVSTEYHLTEYGKKSNKVIYELAAFIVESPNYPEYKNNKEELKKTFETTLNIKNKICNVSCVTYTSIQNYLKGMHKSFHQALPKLFFY